MKIAQYRNWLNEQIKEKIKLDLSKYEMRYMERIDIKTTLYNNNGWMLKCENFTNFNGMVFHLMDMVRHHEEIGPLLEVLIPSHTYDIAFQIPALKTYPLDSYPCLDQDETRIQITAEYSNEKLVKDTCFNIDQFIMPLKDVEDINHLTNILEKLDSISSGYIGIEFFNYDNNERFHLLSHSHMILDSYESECNIESFCFELIKRNEMTIYNEIYSNNKIKEVSDFVLDKVLKTVFSIIMDGMQMADKETMNKALDKIQLMPIELKNLYNNSLNILHESRLSPSVILWRQLLNQDIDYNIIAEAYLALK